MSAPIEDSVYGTSMPILSGAPTAAVALGASVDATTGAVVGGAGGAVGRASGAAGAHAAESAAADPTAAAPASNWRKLRRDRLTCWRSQRTLGPTSSIGRCSWT